jgi:HEAT repeat protein
VSASGGTFRLFGGGVLALAIGAAAARPQDAPPVATLIEDLRSRDFDARMNAVLELERRGSEALGAVPPLLELLEANNVYLMEEALRVAWRLAPEATVVRLKALLWRRAGLGWLIERGVPEPLVRAFVDSLGDPDPVRRQLASGALAWMGTRACAAVPALCEGLSRERHPEALASLAGAIGAIDPWSGAPALRRVAWSAAPLQVRLAAAAGLARADPSTCVTVILELLGPAGRLGIPTVRDRRFSSLERERAIRALGGTGLAGLRAVPVLIEALSDPEDRERAAAARVLGEIGPPAYAAIPALERLLDGAVRYETPARVEAARAIWRIAGIADTTAPVLVRGLNRSSLNPPLGLEAQRTLEEMGERTGTAVSELVRTLRDPYSQAQREAATLLLHAGPAASAAVPHLEEAALGDCRRATNAALLSLARLDPGRAEHVFAQTLQCPDLWARFHTLEAIAKLAPRGRHLISLVERMLRDPETVVRVRAARTLWGLEPGSPGVLGVLATELERDWPELDCVRLLDEVGPAALPVLPAIVAALGSRNPQVREGVARFLGSLGPAAREAAVPLERACSDPNWRVRAAAREALPRVQAK